MSQLRHLSASLLCRLRNEDEGAATAEYAIVIMAAVALGSVLLLVMQSGAVQSIIEDLVVGAFTI
ncbi:DUF4244 domain-containing protein [Gulosibacter macacae]|uniref:DUF4244 domain-containing protein n=1 Tax=Gulosibacter macacae TaxID=2488791 RepID=A0A3P3VYM8_9MICO|nr:DUF4244 domain-containing protein [Gulosibacter macacae]RRJ85783.1 DUF4244 domain-containing protein [Gulosibacter macacae]